jgi:transposase
MVCYTSEDDRTSSKDTRGLLNVFGVYDHTNNNRMFTHCYYKQKNGKQLLDFIRRVDSLYDSNVKRIFLVLDNVSIHKSKKVIEFISRYHLRIKLVFLPIKSPELNLIEVRWMWLQRNAINNNTFKNEQQIGKMVSDWTKYYNQTHVKTITDTLHNELTYAFT